ncbi:CCA tRNA nucleotidyltransferase [Rubrimonas cliftonensis]|uniref:Poly(A) polymerase n=1 Tax=Rubrimonas cliftonensis TaxID=89524 RepID=A0A1H4EX35_9RHOB|nr:CCA tRNA nucleotidyltransferase [Rubrimonas cliftonensis]SEA89536.1 poly(A) polymerase [Rubrimonas cliftonensis]
MSGGPAGAAPDAPARIAPSWLAEPATRAVLAALAPGRPLFVGGCVRDALMGREAQDVDLCVACLPERTIQLLEKAGLKAVPTGLEHGTVTAVAGGRGFETTTLRRDVATDGRRAEVAFTEDVAEDAARRDFTMNALYADADGLVLDPLGGMADLRAGRVRFIGDAATRITEDYLRILRFFRFTAQHGRAGVDAAGVAACAAAKGGLARLSRERVGHEMRRLLGAPDPVAALDAMAAAGVLQEVAPGADAAALARLVAAERAAGAAPDWPRRAAAVLAARGDPPDWRLSRAELARLSAIGRALASREGPAARAHRFGADAARDAALIEAARAGGPPPPDLEAALALGAAAEPPVTAADLMQAGFRPGPELGEALARLREAWIEGGFAEDREALLRRL